MYAYCVVVDVCMRKNIKDDRETTCSKKMCRPNKASSYYMYTVHNNATVYLHIKQLLTFTLIGSMCFNK